jgi:hypothetical protein
MTCNGRSTSPTFQGVIEVKIAQFHGEGFVGLIVSHNEMVYRVAQHRPRNKDSQHGHA